MLDKDYTADTTQLASLPAGLSNGSSKHYSYSLDAQGITATGDGYVLRMPSYTDGRICCEGDCDKINKDYPSCSSFVYEAAACTVPPIPVCEGPECDPEPEPDYYCTPGATESQQCLECGEQTHTCLEDGTWGEWSECPAKPASRTCSACGETVEATCNASTNTWDEPDMSLCKSASACPKACPEESKPKEEDSCTPEGYEEACGKKTRPVTCDTTTGQWEAPKWDTITCQPTEECKQEEEEEEDDEEPSTCATVSDKYWEEQDLDVAEECVQLNIDFEDIDWSKPIAADASPEEWVKVCCGGGCCPSGIYDKGKCVSCEEALGSNFHLDESKGECGECVGIFKPLITDNFMAVSNGSRLGKVYADYTETEFRAGAFVDVAITGTVVGYSRESRACSSCDPNASTCTEKGYMEDAREVLLAWSNEEDTILQGSWYPAGVNGICLTVRKLGGYEPATFRIAPQWAEAGSMYDAQKQKLREWGFRQYDGKQGLISGGDAGINEAGHCGMSGYNHAFAELYYFPKHQKVRGYVCTRD